MQGKNVNKFFFQLLRVLSMDETHNTGRLKALYFLLTSQNIPFEKHNLTL